MNCDKAQEVFSDYLEGTIEPPLALAVRHHLSECAECDEAYQRFRAAWEVLESVPMVDVPVGFHRKLMAHVEECRPPVRRPLLGVDWSSIFTTRVSVRAFAAGVAVAVFAAMLVVLSPRPPKDTAVLGPSPLFQEKPSARIYTPNVAPGLQIAVERENAGTDMTTFRIALKLAPGVKIIQPVVTLVPGWEGGIGQLESAAPVLHRGIRAGEEVEIPVVVQHSQFSQDAVTVYVAWTHKGDPFSSIIFLPTQKLGGPLNQSSVAEGSTDIFQALKLVSARYAAIIVASGNMLAKVPAWPMAGPIEDALNSMKDAVPIKWTKVAYKSYIVEPE